MNSSGVGVCEEGADGGCALTQSSPSLLLLLPVLCSCLWILFQLLYGSWVFAFLVSKVTNFFLTDGGLSIGKLLKDIVCA